jgi:TolB-like protein/DNA-binding winged helix-turn-helix (wHTH) protein/Tfp pilus assembly protein PilF
MSQSNQQQYEFGQFRLDTEKRLLLRDGEAVSLAPKAFDLLLVLVRHSGQALEKDKLMEMLWPDSIVEEANLPQNISALRKALGETPNERKYIITVPGRGYKFAADVQEFAGESQSLLVEKYTKSTLVIEEENQRQEYERKSKGLPDAFGSPGSRPKLLFISLAFAILVLGITALYFLSGKGPSTTTAIQSLAILPFVNASADANAEYLSDGITESLINSFSQLPQLKVTARTTAFRYKGKETDAQAIGRDLRVDAIITGRVIQQGDTLIVQADLLNTADGTQIWGNRYSRRPSDIFAVHEEIANAIAEQLRYKLTGEEKQALSKRYTENIKAYQYYSQGWRSLQRRTRQDFFTAISYFEKAIEEDSNYALAYAALTEVYVSLAMRGLIEPAEGRRKAQEAARKALSLDENLAEAHAAIGETYIFFAPFDFATGDRELRRAIEISPSLTIAHQVLGASLQEQGRFDEALEVWVRARELDPLSPIIARLEAWNYLFRRDYPRSLELLRQSKELGPPFIMWGEIEIYIQNRKLDEGLAELEKEKARMDDPFLIYRMGMIAAAQGKRAAALQTIKELEQISGASLHRAMWIAMLYATLSEKELALSWLERGLEAGAITLFYKDAPVWDTVRSNPRFDELLRRMGVSQ